jgi:hypothetical protein
LSSGRFLVGTSSAYGNNYLQIQGDAAAGTGTGAISLRRGAALGAMGSGSALGLVDFAFVDGGVGAQIAGICDGGAGTNDYPGRLVFSTTADGASSPTERMRINNAGAVFLNGGTSLVTGNPVDGLHVGTVGSHLGNSSLTLGDSLATARWRLTTGSHHLSFYQNDGSGTYVSRAYVTNSTGAYVAVSDERAKKLILDSTYGIEQLKQLRPVAYLMKDQDESTARRNLGFIAQEVKDVIPEAVITPEDPEEQFYGLEHTALIPVLTKALQEAVAKIETLEAKVAALEAA